MICCLLELQAALFNSIKQDATVVHFYTIVDFKWNGSISDLHFRCRTTSTPQIACVTVADVGDGRVQAPRGADGAPGTSLLDRIDNCCRHMQLPRQIRGRPEFAFLQ